MISMPGSHSHSPTSTPTSSFPSATTTPGAYSKHHSLTMMLFFDGLPFALCVSAKSCFSASLFFSKYVMKVALYWPTGPRLAASAVAHLSSSRTVPWPLVLRLLASNASDVV